MGTDIHGWLQEKNYEGEWENKCAVPSDRNYTLFAALANVRNGYGFAGCKTGEAIRFIADPRGLPEGVDNDDLAYGDHSFTHMTLREMLEWDGWQQPVYYCGYVERKHYESLADGEKPSEWCGGVEGRGVVKTTRDAIATGSAPDDWTYVFVEWETGPLIDRIGPWREWMAYLRAEVSEWQMDRHRIVIGFDS